MMLRCFFFFFFPKYEYFLIDFNNKERRVYEYTDAAAL